MPTASHKADINAALRLPSNNRGMTDTQRSLQEERRGEEAGGNRAGRAQQGGSVSVVMESGV